MELAQKHFTDEQLTEFGFVAWRQVPSMWMGVTPMTYGKGRLCADLNSSGYEDGWCYERLIDAVVAMHQWDPETQKEPEGWMRHPMSGRRRPGGDASKEYVAR